MLGISIKDDQDIGAALLCLGKYALNGTSLTLVYPVTHDGSPGKFSD